MIRDFLPIPLIPAAWVLTFGTLVYPGIDTYWIQHMNLFITIFLAVFGAVSWEKMSKDSVLRTWRNVIAAGFVFTALGTLPFYLQNVASYLMDISLLYWFIAPGIAFRITANKSENYSDYFRWLYYLTAPALVLFFHGVYTGSDLSATAGLALVAALQTLSIVLASKMDYEWQIM